MKALLFKIVMILKNLAAIYDKKYMLNFNTFQLCICWKTKLKFQKTLFTHYLLSLYNILWIFLNSILLEYRKKKCYYSTKLIK